MLVAATYDRLQPSPSPNSATPVAKSLATQTRLIVDAAHDREAADERLAAADPLDHVADDEHEPVHADDVRADHREDVVLAVAVAAIT